MSTEKFFGIILWADRDGTRGVLADIEGQTWRFNETVPEHGSFNRVPVYENGWRPKVSIKQNPRTGKEFVTTEVEVVEFSIDFFKYRDGRDGHQITSLCAASDYRQDDAKQLFIVREKYEMQKREERRMRYEKQECEKGFGLPLQPPINSKNGESQNGRQENRTD